MSFHRPHMRLVVIDLIPALLSWEGRDRSTSLEMAPDGPDAIAHLYSHYRLIGLADADVSSTAIRKALEDNRATEFFDSVGTSGGFGPAINPRVIRRITRMSRTHEPVVFVTARESLGRLMSRSRVGVVLTTREEFGAVPDAVASLISGRVSP